MFKSKSGWQEIHSNINANTMGAKVYIDKNMNSLSDWVNANKKSKMTKYLGAIVLNWFQLQQFRLYFYFNKIVLKSMSLGIFDAWLMRCDIGTLKLEIRFHFECNMYQSESTGNFFECYWQDKNEWIFFAINMIK